MIIWRDRKFWNKVREAGGDEGHFVFMLDGEEQWVFVNKGEKSPQHLTPLWGFTVQNKFMVFINFGFTFNAGEVKNHTLFHVPEKVSIEECENILAIMALQL